MTFALPLPKIVKELPIRFNDKQKTMKKTTTILLSAVVLFLAACSDAGGFKKTKSGLLYKIVSDGKGEMVKRGEFLKVNYTQKIRDSILGTSYGAMPTYAPCDSVGPIYNPAEIFPLLHKGDSVVVVMMADSLYKKAMQRPPFVKKGDKFTLTFRVVDILKDQQALRNDQQTIFDEQKVKEIKEIEEYLAKHNIKAQKTAKGTFVVIDNPGAGPSADSGKAVHVKYTGKTFAGTPFDSNIDSSFGHTDPYVLVIGSRGAIEGWDDGLRLFKKGATGQLYVPSMLAYGGNPPQGAPFKPFENLMFDIQVVDVTDAPQPGQRPMPVAPRAK